MGTEIFTVSQLLAEYANVNFYIMMFTMFARNSKNLANTNMNKMRSV